MRMRVLGLALLLTGCANTDMPQLGVPPEAIRTTERQAVETQGMGEPSPEMRRRVLALSREATDVPPDSCERQSAEHCRFINAPVKLSHKAIRLSGEPYPFFHTRNTLRFVDARKRTWVAPAGILTDGASIPPIFVPLIGNPRSPEFLNAAVVHDSYSAESNRDTPYYHTAPWQDVHRMFYDALRVSGTPPVKAKIMYAAVYLGGPRWSEVRTPSQGDHADHGGMRKAERRESPDTMLRIRLRNGTTVTAAGARGIRALQANGPLTVLLDRNQLVAAFEQAKAFIENDNPSIRDVEIYLTQLEQDMMASRSTPRTLRRKQNFGTAPADDTRDTGGEGGNESTDGEGLQ